MTAESCSASRKAALLLPLTAFVACMAVWLVPKPTVHYIPCMPRIHVRTHTSRIDGDLLLERYVCVELPLPVPWHSLTITESHLQGVCKVCTALYSTWYSWSKRGQGSCDALLPNGRLFGRQTAASMRHKPHVSSAPAEVAATNTVSPAHAAWCGAPT